ncbi:MAG TPA: secretin and TonB N-terminal domain-containing protein [Nitrosospira sp.]|nr:secretin and TonB N-terminal domain-containing protein [Nitrosospira sp.]
MRLQKYILIASVMLAFAGCATKNTALIEGNRLISEGNLDMGLASLEQAAREKPHDLQIRAVLARQRDAVTARLLFEADTARSSGDLDLAEQKYRHVLRLVPRNERAQAGMETLDADRRHLALVKNAQELMERNEYTAAEPLIRQVLQENPLQPAARQLMQKITEMESELDRVGPVLKTAFTKPVTLEFRDAGLKSVFEIIARTAGLNFVFDKDVKQDTKTTIFVKDARVEDIFKLLLLTNQLTHKVLNENSVLIYPNTPPKQKEYQDLMVRSFFVTYTDVKQMVAMVKGLVKTKDVHIDEKLNLFVMKDTPEAIRLVARMVALNDVADPEVMLEVEVLEIGRNRLLNLGLQYPDNIRVNMLAAGAALTGGAITPPGTFNISSEGVNGSGSNLDRLTGFITNPAMIINLKQQDGIVNTLANPRIRVKNREKAKIHIGDKVPVVTTTATANVGVASSVSYLDVGLKVDVESTISLKDDVSMKINLEVSTIVKEVQLPNSGIAYQVGTRNASTTLALKDGETQVLAGLISDDERATLAKVPGLGDLPWVGKLFTNQNLTRNKTEIALLITPRIIRNIPRPSRASTELHFGTENNVGVVPVSIGKTPARSLGISPSSSGGSAGGMGIPMPGNESPPGQLAASPRPDSPTVTIAAPEQALAGKEFGVSVNLSGAESLPSGEVELNYDPTALELLDGGEKSGSRTVKVSKGGGSVELRFQVVAQKPGTTQVAVRNVAFRDESGNPIPAQVVLPPVASIDIR